MIFTTRDPSEALKFISCLNFEEEEKNQIAAFIPLMTQLMEEMKRSKKVNSKGGERWFASRLERKVAEAQNTIGVMLAGLDGEDLARAKVMASQNAAAGAVLDLARECEASSETLKGLSDYKDTIIALFQKYSGINRRREDEPSFDDDVDHEALDEEDESF